MVAMGTIGHSHLAELSHEGFQRIGKILASVTDITQTPNLENDVRDQNH